LIINFGNLSQGRIYRLLHRDSKSTTLFLSGESSKYNYVHVVADRLGLRIFYIEKPTLELIAQGFTYPYVYIHIDDMKDQERHSLCDQMKQNKEVVFIGGHSNDWDVVHHLKSCRIDPEFVEYHEYAPIEIWIQYILAFGIVFFCICSFPCCTYLGLRKTSQILVDRIAKEFEKETQEQYQSRGIQFSLNSKIELSIHVKFQNDIVTEKMNGPIENQPLLSFPLNNASK
jgi:hypothetical protein